MSLLDVMAAAVNWAEQRAGGPRRAPTILVLSGRAWLLRPRTPGRFGPGGRSAAAHAVAMRPSSHQKARCPPPRSSPSRNPRHGAWHHGQAAELLGFQSPGRHDPVSPPGRASGSGQRVARRKAAAAAHPQSADSCFRVSPCQAGELHTCALIYHPQGQRQLPGPRSRSDAGASSGRAPTITSRSPAVERPWLALGRRASKGDQTDLSWPRSVPNPPGTGALPAPDRPHAGKRNRESGAAQWTESAGQWRGPLLARHGRAQGARPHWPVIFTTTARCRSLPTKTPVARLQGRCSGSGLRRPSARGVETISGSPGGGARQASMTRATAWGKPRFGQHHIGTRICFLAAARWRIAPAAGITAGQPLGSQAESSTLLATGSPGHKPAAAAGRHTNQGRSFTAVETGGGAGQGQPQGWPAMNVSEGAQGGLGANTNSLEQERGDALLPVTEPHPHVLPPPVSA